MLIFKLALRNIFRNRRRSLLTIISMGGGYFLLSAMAAMTEGSYSHMIDLFTSDHTGHVQVHHSNYLTRPSLYKTIQNPQKVTEQLKQYEQVLEVAPRIYGPSLAYGKNKSFPANVIGIDPEAEANTTLLKRKMAEGEYLTSGMTQDGYFPALVGVTLARNLKLNVGDELVLISQGIDGSIANDIFQITGLVGTDDSHERLNVYLSLPAIKQFLSMGNQVHELALRLEHQKQARKFSQALQEQEEWQSKELSVEPWQVVEEAFYKGMQADKKGNYVSMGIIIFIVAIGVLNTVLMGTLERTHEFGVLRAIGTRPMGISTMILLESLLLSFSACVVGALFAWPLNYWMSTEGIQLPQAIDMGGIQFDVMLGEISWFSMGMPLLVVVLSTFIVSIYPAIRAARISPLQAMQER